MTTLNADEPIRFSSHDLQQLNAAVRVLKHSGFASRYQIVRAFDKDNGVIGMNGIGEKRAAILRKALKAGPGRWAQLTDVVPPFAGPEEIGADMAGAIAAGIRSAPDKLYMVFGAADYPGGGISDYLRAFYSLEDAERGVEQYAATGDYDWFDIADLKTWDGSARLLKRYSHITEDGAIVPAWEWAETPIPAPWGSAFGAPAGTQSGFVDMPPAVDNAAAVQTIDADPRGGSQSEPVELFPELASGPVVDLETDGENGDDTEDGENA